MIRSNLCGYSDAYIHVKGSITVPNNGTTTAPNNRNKNVIFKNCASFTNCINKIKNTQVDKAHDIDVVMSMYNLIEYSDAYSKTLESLWQYYRDESALNNNNFFINFPADKNDIISFKFNQQITEQIGNNGTNDVEIMVPLKHLSNFWRTPEIPLINCEISITLTWSKIHLSAAGTTANQEPIFTKLYVPVVTLLTKDNAKLLKQLESGFKRTVYWNKYHSKVTQQAQNQNLDFLIDPSFQGVNRLFVLSFENSRVRENCKQDFYPTVEIKDYNVIIDGKDFFDQRVKNDLRTYDKIRKTDLGQGDDYTTGCLLDYPYFKKHYKLIALDLSKQQKLDADPKAIQQINFTGNLDLDGNTQMFFIIEESRETVRFFKRNS